MKILNVLSFVAWNGKSSVGWRKRNRDGGTTARPGADQHSEGAA